MEEAEQLKLKISKYKLLVEQLEKYIHELERIYNPEEHDLKKSDYVTIDIGEKMDTQMESKTIVKYIVWDKNKETCSYNALEIDVSQIQENWTKDQIESWVQKCVYQNFIDSYEPRTIGILEVIRVVEEKRKQNFKMLQESGVYWVKINGLNQVVELCKSEGDNVLGSFIYPFNVETMKANKIYGTINPTDIEKWCPKFEMPKF